jgi:hypothetical protein
MMVLRSPLIIIDDGSGVSLPPSTTTGARARRCLPCLATYHHHKTRARAHVGGIFLSMLLVIVPQPPIHPPSYKSLVRLGPSALSIPGIDRETTTTTTTHLPHRDPHHSTLHISNKFVVYLSMHAVDHWKCSRINETLQEYIKMIITIEEKVID